MQKEAMVTEHPYKALLSYKAKKGSFPAMRGHLYENDVIVASFKRAPVRDGFVPDLEVTFYSSQAQARFNNFADCLSIQESVLAVLEEATS